MGKRSRGWKNLRNFMKENWVWCQYCENSRATTMDHVIPKSMGGRYNAPNAALACEPCNNAKGSKLLDPKPMRVRYQVTPMHAGQIIKDEVG